MSLDTRITAIRPDLASRSLEGRIRAARFADPKPMQVALAVTAIRAEPRDDAEQVDQLLFGELFDVLDRTGAFAWGQARRDGYVGFVEIAALRGDIHTPTHWVSAPRTFVFEAPAIRARALGPLGLNAVVAIEAEETGMARATGLGWIPAAHLSPVGHTLSDPAGVANRQLGAPYVWGGRDSLGLDCSGLVQQAFFACGRACPRDADQQAALGDPAPEGQLARGDLVCWRGHIGIMLDGERLLHANAHHMAVAAEPLAEAIARIALSGGEPTAYRRVRP